MPSEDSRAQSHAAADAAAAAVAHGHHLLPPVNASHGKKWKKTKHVSSYANGVGVADARYDVVVVAPAAAVAPAAGGGQQRHHHRRPPASERTGGRTSKYEYEHDYASMRHERGFRGGGGHYSESAPPITVTVRPNGVVIGGKRKHQDGVGMHDNSSGGGDSYYGNDHASHVTPRPNGVATGGYSSGGGGSHYGNGATAATLSSEPPPPASPHGHRTPPAKPHGARSVPVPSESAAAVVPARAFGGGGLSRYDEAPSASARPNGVVTGGKRKHPAASSSPGQGNNGSAYANDRAAAPGSSSSRLPGGPSFSASAAPPDEHDDAEKQRVGLQAVMLMGEADLLTEVHSYGEAVQQPAPEKEFSFWLTEAEKDSQFAALRAELAAEATAASSSNGKRRRP